MLNSKNRQQFQNSNQYTNITYTVLFPLLTLPSIIPAPPINHPFSEGLKNKLSGWSIRGTRYNSAIIFQNITSPKIC